MIPDEIIEQVRDASDLVGIVAEHVELKRTGADYRGPCPFHGGTHRNFAVIPKKGMFYCFVCHEAGDVFTFFMKKFGMDYPTAVREAARRVGITVPERGTAAAGPDPSEPLFAAVALAADWFARQLRESPEAEVARQYLRSRELDLEAVLPLGLGYAPRGSGLLDAMKSLGVRDSVLLEAGLAVKRDDGSVVPRFRGRLLFPIHDLRARVIGLGGRILGAGEPKYLNSPDTPIFHKGKLLYNLHVAKHAIRKAERAILVEGYFDVLRLALAGLEEIVAPLGTGLSAEQAQLLARYTSHVILLYDSDAAGLRATFRAGDELLRHGLRVSVASLPEGEDPDTLVQRRGADALAELLKDAMDLFERKVQILDRKGFFASLPGRRRALDRLLPTIRAARDGITRELYISRAAEAAGIRKDALEREVGSARKEEGSGTREAGSAPALPASRLPLPALASGAEQAFLTLMLEGEPWRARVLEVVDAEDFEFGPYRAVFEALVEDAPERLDETAARAFEQLRAAGLGARQADDVFAGAVGWIEARGLQRQVELIDRELPLASEDEKLELVLQKKRLSAEMNARYPKYKIATRRSSAPGT
jgi:DNA primase